MAVPKNLYGIGISPLSMSNKRDGLSEELVANKPAGLLGILQDSGGPIISAEHMARCKEHLRLFIEKCTDENTIGKIFKINVTDELVRIITGSVNLFDNVVKLECGTKAPIAFRFDIDFDVYTKDDSVLCNLDDLKIRIEFSLYKNSTFKTYAISEKLIDLNKKAFKLDVSEIIEPEPEPEEEETPVVDPEITDETNEASNSEEAPVTEPEESGEEETTPVVEDNTTVVNNSLTEYFFQVNTMEISVPEDYDPNKFNIVIHDILLDIV